MFNVQSSKNCYMFKVLSSKFVGLSDSVCLVCLVGLVCFVYFVDFVGMAVWVILGLGKTVDSKIESTGLVHWSFLVCLNFYFHLRSGMSGPLLFVQVNDNQTAKLLEGREFPQ